MKDDFYTMGGGHFWEDVFFYQKWRIQRNSKTKEFRLLDQWDIRRYEGGFEECRQAFVKYISLYQLPRQKGHMIIMIHGLGQTKNIFRPLWRKAIESGYMAAAINYPSIRRRIDSHVKQFNFLLNHLEDVQEVSFVSVGIGGIILRKLLASKEPWTTKLKINRAVQICPPNQGAYRWAQWGKNKLVRRIFGPMVDEMDEQYAAATFPKLPKGRELGIIVTNKKGCGLLRFLPEKWQRYFNTAEESQLDGAKEMIYIPNRHWNPLNNQRIVNACINFIKNGQFNGKKKS